MQQLSKREGLRRVAVASVGSLSVFDFFHDVQNHNNGDLLVPTTEIIASHSNLEIFIFSEISVGRTSRSVRSAFSIANIDF